MLGNCIKKSPPYYRQEKKLYKNAFDDEKHKELAMAIQTLHDHHLIVTYDDTLEIEEIYGADHENMRYTLQYMATQKRREQELFFHSPITTVESFDKVIFEDKNKPLHTGTAYFSCCNI